jgi:hypothetical protein
MGPRLALNYKVGGLDPGQDPRSPDIIVTPNVGVTCIGPGSALGDHGGFGRDDTNGNLAGSQSVFLAEDRFKRHNHYASRAHDLEGSGPGSPKPRRSAHRRHSGVARACRATR